MPLLRPRVEGTDKPAPGERIPIAAKKKDAGNSLKVILELIPTEVIAAYKALIGTVPVTYPSWRLWISILGMPVTFLWIAYATRPEGKPVAWRQAIISPVAFAVWAAAIQPDVMKTLYADWQIWMGSVLMIGGMLLLRILDRVLYDLGVKQKA